jgi:hypothetical protein
MREEQDPLTELTELLKDPFTESQRRVLLKLHANVDELRTNVERRLLRVESQVAELLDGIGIVSGMIAGWFVADAVVAKVVGASGILSEIIWLVCFVGTLFVVASILKRVAFKGAPDHVRSWVGLG